jgi:hypothetical protein
MSVQIYTKYYTKEDAEEILKGLGYEKVNGYFSNGNLNVKVSDVGDLEKSVFIVEDKSDELWKIGKDSGYYFQLGVLSKHIGGNMILNSSCEPVFSELIKSF